MSSYRYYIWKNGKLVSDCQRLSTVLNRLLKITRKSNPDKDSIWYCDTISNVKLRCKRISAILATQTIIKTSIESSVGVLFCLWSRGEGVCES